MGKFLKILRYIANLIAIMGANQSKQTTPPYFSINSSDFKPDEPVWDMIDEMVSSKISDKYPSLFEFSFRGLKTVKNPMTGDIYCLSVGQFLLKLEYDRRKHDVLEVLFRKKMVTFAEISFPSIWNFFRKDPILRIGDDEYPLPNYMSVLRREITEVQFIQQLQRQYSCSDVEKIWKVLTDREVLYFEKYKSELLKSTLYYKN